MGGEEAIYHTLISAQSHRAIGEVARKLDRNKHLLSFSFFFFFIKTGSPVTFNGLELTIQTGLSSDLPPEF